MELGPYGITANTIHPGAVAGEQMLPIDGDSQSTL